MQRDNFAEVLIPSNVIDWAEPHCPECRKVPNDDKAYFDETGAPVGCDRCIDTHTTEYACDIGILECPTCGADFLDDDHDVYFGHNNDHVLGCEKCWTTGHASDDEYFMRRNGR